MVSRRDDGNARWDVDARRKHHNAVIYWMSKDSKRQ